MASNKSCDLFGFHLRLVVSGAKARIVLQLLSSTNDRKLSVRSERRPTRGVKTENEVRGDPSASFLAEEVATLVR